MRTFATAAALMLVAINLIGFTNVMAQDDCEVESADPASYHFVGGIYVEERGDHVSAGGMAVPGTGFVLGSGTWVYQESNGLPGLQRGGLGPIGSDSVNDETCGAGPDTLIF